MGFRSNLILLVVVALLLATLYHFTRDPSVRPPGEKDDISLQVISDLEFHKCREYRILPHAEGRAEEIILRKQGREVMVVEPVRDVARRAYVEQLFSACTALRLEPFYGKEELEKDPSLWEKAGLKEPRRRIVFVLEDGTERTLYVGDPSPTTAGVFVRFADKVFVSNNRAIDTALQTNVDQVREVRLFRQPRVDRVRVERKRPGGKIEVLELAVEPSGYRILKPRPLRADQAAAGAFMKSLGGMLIDRFLQGGGELPEAMADRTPDFRIVIDGVWGKREVTFYDGDASGGQRLLGFDKLRNIAFVVNRNYGLNAMNRSFQDLRARVLMPISDDEIHQIDIQPGAAARAKGAKTMQFKRGMGGVFRMEAPVKAKLHPTRLNRIAKGLRNMVVREFIDSPKALEEYGLGEDALVVTVRGRRGGKPIVLRIGREAGDTAFLQRADEDHVVAVDRGQTEPLHTPWTKMLSLRGVLKLSYPPLRLDVQVGKKSLHYHKMALGKETDAVWRETNQGPDDPPNHDLAELVGDMSVLRDADGRFTGGLRARSVREHDSGLGEPIVLRFARRPEQGSTAVLTMRLYVTKDKVWFSGDGVPSGLVYEAGRGLAELAKRWAGN